MTMREAGLLVLLGATYPMLASAVTAQTTTDSAARAAATITAADMARDIGVLSDDSMHGRRTPSRELDLTAKYVAEQFRRLGLQPLNGEELLQRYPVPGQIKADLAAFSIRGLTQHCAAANCRTTFKENGDQLPYKWLTVPLPAMARFYPGVPLPTVPEWGSGADKAVLLAGRLTPASLQSVQLRNKVAIYVPEPGADSASRSALVTALLAQARGVVVVSDGDSARFGRSPAALAHPLTIVDNYMKDANGPHAWPWAVEVWRGAIDQFLGAAGVDLPESSGNTPVIHEFKEMYLALQADLRQPDTTKNPIITAPYVAAFLEGADPKLKSQYVMYSAHLDRVGDSLSGDSVMKAPDEHAASTASLLALAKAFSQPGARPRRSILFLATSGGARGPEDWGNNFVVNNKQEPMQRVVLYVAMDGATRGSGDSVVIDGVGDIDFEVSPVWMTSSHPELGLRVVSGETTVQSKADYFAFIRTGVPTLAFRGAGKLPSAGPGPRSSLDVERIARVTRLAFYMGQQLANGDQRPRWTAAGRQRYLEFAPPD